MAARLLQRAAEAVEGKGGGLPTAPADRRGGYGQSQRLHAQLNLISITDGQIVLDAKLFYEGRKPAVDVGTGVARVGGKPKRMRFRDVAETLLP